MATEVDHSELLELVLEIDDKGTRLNRDEIDFVAGIIDSKQTTFSDEEARRIRRLHHRKVR